MLKYLLKPLAWLMLGLIYFYKGCISPLLPKSCIYQPSCSTYALIAIKRFGPIKGTIMGIKRIFRCNPHHIGGVDNVIDNFKGEIKWIL